MKNIKSMASTLALFSVLMLGMAGLAFAGPTGGGGSNTITPSMGVGTAPTILGIACPAFIEYYGSTNCIISIKGMQSGDPTPTGIVDFSTSPANIGSFSSSSCTLSASGAWGTCNVIYSSNAITTPIPDLVATYQGDNNYATEQGYTASQIEQATCGITSSAASLDLSLGNIATLSITNTGNVAGTVFISGTDWENAADTASFPVTQTLWGLSTPPSTALTASQATVGTLASSANEPLYISATPPATPQTPGIYSQQITLTSSC